MRDTRLEGKGGQPYNAFSIEDETGLQGQFLFQARWYVFSNIRASSIHVFSNKEMIREPEYTSRARLTNRPMR